MAELYKSNTSGGGYTINPVLLIDYPGNNSLTPIGIRDALMTKHSRTVANSVLDCPLTVKQSPQVNWPTG